MATTSITGTTYVEDTTLRSGAASTWNYGGSTGVSSYSSTSTRRNGLVRCASTQIPAGTINEMRLYGYQTGQSGNHTIDVYRVADANTWVEGTGTGGSTQTGSCCWDYAKYTSQTWAGSSGCSTSTTDYDASPSYTWTPTISTMTYVSLSTTWATNWRDTTSTNQGVLLYNPAAGASTVAWQSTEETGSNQIYWWFDYTAGGGTTVPVFYYNLQTHGIA